MVLFYLKMVLTIFPTLYGLFMVDSMFSMALKCSIYNNHEESFFLLVQCIFMFVIYPSNVSVSVLIPNDFVDSLHDIIVYPNIRRLEFLPVSTEVLT